jgi:hypothetical protein
MATAVAIMAMLLPSATDAARHCRKTFTLPMDKRAANVIYAGANPLTHHERALMRRLVRCQRRARNVRRARRYNQARRAAWHQRRLDATSMQPAVASWYDTDGVGACGYGNVQAGLRFASLFLACGTWIRICNGPSCVDAEMVDHGPYVAGRDFDLNANLRDALGCGGICAVRWRLL